MKTLKYGTSKFTIKMKNSDYEISFYNGTCVRGTAQTQSKHYIFQQPCTVSKIQNGVKIQKQLDSIAESSVWVGNPIYEVSHLAESRTEGKRQIIEKKDFNTKAEAEVWIEKIMRKIIRKNLKERAGSL